MFQQINKHALKLQMSHNEINLQANRKRLYSTSSRATKDIIYKDDLKIP